MCHIHRARRAFTLVELLVVVAIIALLLGILLPALGRARKVATVSACLANLRQIGTGIVTYEIDQGTIPWRPVANGAMPYEVPNPNGTIPTSQLWASKAALGESQGARIGLAMLMTSNDFPAKAFFCPGDDTNNLEEEMPGLIETDDGDHVFGSYSYRQLAETDGNGSPGKGKLANFGLNSNQEQARALAFDLNSRMSANPRSNHEGELVNCVFTDASAISFTNSDDRYSLLDADFSMSDPFMNGPLNRILRRLDRAFMDGGKGEPAD